MSISQGCQERVEVARRLAVSASRLSLETRVLLAAAEASEATVSRSLRAAVACVIADKLAPNFSSIVNVRGLRAHVEGAVSSAGLAGSVTPAQITNLAWRLVFDLWGGPTP